MSTHRTPRRHQERGAVLIITIIMLVVITLITLTSVRTATGDERMAGNARDRNKAFQAAEAAVQRCLAMLDGHSYPGTIQNPTTAPAAPLWEVESNWTSSGYPVSMPTADLFESPKCLVENFGTGGYRVTARAKGGSEDTVVILQATYTQE